MIRRLFSDFRRPSTRADVLCAMGILAVVYSMFIAASAVLICASHTAALGACLFP